MPVGAYFGGNGQKVKRQMRKKYGKKAGDRVFYATANKQAQRPEDRDRRNARMLTNARNKRKS